jgi:hypothetical protein
MAKTDQAREGVTHQQDARHIVVAAGIVVSINVDDNPVITLKSGATAILRKKHSDNSWMITKVSALSEDIEIELNGLQFTQPDDLN